MNISLNIDLINEIETSYPVLSWTAEGYQIWPYVRIRLMYLLHNNQNHSNHSKGRESRLKLIAHRGTTIVSGIYRQSYANFRDDGHSRKSQNKSKILFFGDTRNCIALAGRWFNQLYGPIWQYADEIGYCPVVYEWSPDYQFNSSKWHSLHYIQVQLDMLQLLRRLAVWRRSFCYVPQYSDVMHYVHAMTGVNLPSERALNNEIKGLLIIHDFWKKKLLRIQPKFVFAVEYYSYVGLALMMASARLKIPTIDIQHGTQGDFHPAYGRWTKLPFNGYEMLPKIFWNWSDEDASTINTWATNSNFAHKGVNGGHPWLLYWYEQLAGSSATTGLSANFSSRQHELTHILLTLQPFEALCEPPAWLLERIRMPQSNTKWWIRLHPCMKSQMSSIKAYFKLSPETLVDFDNATSLPLPNLLHFVHAHITLSSSCVKEAATFDVPSAVMHEDARYLYSKELKDGKAYFVSNNEDLSAFLSKIKANRQQGNAAKLKAGYRTQFKKIWESLSL